MSDMKIYNVNVGILGHVDSGKTSLVAAMSQILSTAALDKHPQSKERGITLDLGFSSTMISPPPAHLVTPSTASSFAGGASGGRVKGVKGEAPVSSASDSDPSASSSSPDPDSSAQASGTLACPSDGLSGLQLTFVDCPGHASLIRTVLGGVQITDILVLVVDVTKGIQAQTAECLVVGEMATGRMVVALNKTDLLPERDRAKAVARAAKRVAKTLRMTRFAGAPIVPVSALSASGSSPSPSGPLSTPLPSSQVGVAAAAAALLPSPPPSSSSSSSSPKTNRSEFGFKKQTESSASSSSSPPPSSPFPSSSSSSSFPLSSSPSETGSGIRDLIDAICALVPPPKPEQYPSRTDPPPPPGSGAEPPVDSKSAKPAKPAKSAKSAKSEFLFAFDHCFQVKGHGTVLTGTVLKGSVRVGDSVSLPALGETRAVKSMQMFRRPVRLAVRGDRLGVCVRNLDPNGIERGILAAPGLVPTFSLALARVDKVRFFPGRVPTRSKIHLTVGAHSTVVASIVCILGLQDGLGLPSQEAALDAMAAELVAGGSGTGGAAHGADVIDDANEVGRASSSFDLSRDYVWQEELYGLEGRPISESHRRRRTSARAAQLLSGVRQGSVALEDLPELFRNRLTFLLPGSKSGAKTDSESRKRHVANCDGGGGDGGGGGGGGGGAPRHPYDPVTSKAYEQEEQEEEEDETSPDFRHWGPQWILFRFPQPVTAPRDAMVIGAKLDADIGSGKIDGSRPGSGFADGGKEGGSNGAEVSACRFALYGRVVQIFEEEEGGAVGSFLSSSSRATTTTTTPAAIISSSPASSTRTADASSSTAASAGEGGGRGSKGKPGGRGRGTGNNSAAAASSSSSSSAFSSRSAPAAAAAEATAIAPLSRLRVFKDKIRDGALERLLGHGSGSKGGASSSRDAAQTLDEQGLMDGLPFAEPGVEAIGCGMFKRETELSVFTGMKVLTGLGEEGVIEGPFGKSSKFRISFPKGLIAPLDGRSLAARVLSLLAKRRCSLGSGSGNGSGSGSGSGNGGGASGNEGKGPLVQ